MDSRRNDPHRYDDIIHLPHHVSETHPQMSLYDRAAQFMPFRALTGYEDDILETTRLTDERIELDAERIELLDGKLRFLEAHLSESPTVSVTYFRSDERKAGGAYLLTTDIVKKIDTVDGVVVMRNGARIRIIDIFAIEGEIFASFEE